MTHTIGYDRLRVSMPYTLLDIVPIFDENPLLIDKLTVNGTVTYDGTNGVVKLITSGASFGPGKVVRQTFTYVSSQPGKSKLAILSGVMATVNGTTSRIGTFDDADDKIISDSGNGPYFEVTTMGGISTCSVVLRFNMTNTVVPQTSWNIDKMDGVGPSTFNITNWGRVMSYVIDMQWIGVIRFGLYINGLVYPVHIFTGSGLGTPYCAAVTLPYIRMPKLPVRYELSSIDGANGSATMLQLSGSVMSEGGYEPSGIRLSYAMSSAVAVSNSSNVDTPILSLCLASSEPFNRMTLSDIGCAVTVTKSSA